MTLKPCPFCGADLVITGTWADHPDNDCVLSTADNMDGSPLVLSEDEYPAWNRRADEPEEGR
jgi:hypothetical protein